MATPKLFFMSGRIKWLGIPKAWEKPADEATFEKQIQKSDFIVATELQECGLSSSETIRQDLQDLKYVLLDPYFQSSQKAKHYQNDYFRQQTILVVGTFLSSLIATITMTVTSDMATGLGTTTRNIIQVAGIATAVVTFITTIVTYLVQRNRPQYEWYVWRTTTEELRRHYFLYLAHLPPYHTTECAEVLEANVAQIVTHQQPDMQSTTTVEGPPRPQHAEADLEGLTKLYRAKRLDGQLAFYNSRLDEYKLNTNFVSFAGVTFVALATLLSAVNSVFGEQWIVLIIALLPVMAALLVLFENVYGWGRQIVLYQEAVRQLTIDRTIPPVEGRAPARPYAAIFTDFVSAVENTLRSETNQWGQSVLKDGANAPTLSAQETLELALAKSNLSKEQIDNVRRIFNEQS